MEEKEIDMCLDCGELLPVEELYYGPDPYVEEINNFIRETVLCPKCYLNALESI